MRNSSGKVRHSPKLVLIVLALAGLVCQPSLTHAQTLVGPNDPPPCLNFNLDPTFGVGGRVVTSFPGGTDIATDVAVQSDGKIVVGGASARAFALTRYNTDGTLDQTFGTGGRVNTDFLNGGGARGNALVIQPDGKIVLVGSATDSDGGTGFALVRYNTDGSLDTSFGLNGRVVTNMSGFEVGWGEFEPFSSAADVALQPDGKLVLAGTTNTPGDESSIALARYNGDGSLDNTFDGDGKVRTGSFDHSAQAVALQADGRILIGGMSFPGPAIFRYNTDGSLDKSFDADGEVTSTFGVSALALQSDGRIIAAGQAGTSGAADFGLARYNPDGSLDNTFDSDGKVTTDFGSNDVVDAVVIQPDGRIVAAGFGGTTPGERSFALARYNQNGSPDNTFDSDGKVLTEFGGNVLDEFSSRFGALGVALQTDGRIVAVGDSNISGQPDFGVARYNTDGSLDIAGFGVAGKVSTDFPLREEGIWWSNQTEKL